MKIKGSQKEILAGCWWKSVQDGGGMITERALTACHETFSVEPFFSFFLLLFFFFFFFGFSVIDRAGSLRQELRKGLVLTNRQ